MTCGYIDSTLIFFSALGACFTAGLLFGASILLGYVRFPRPFKSATKYEIDDTWSRDPWRDTHG